MHLAFESKIEGNDLILHPFPVLEGRKKKCHKFSEDTPENSMHGDSHEYLIENNFSQWFKPFCAELVLYKMSTPPWSFNYSADLHLGEGKKWKYADDLTRTSWEVSKASYQELISETHRNKWARTRLDFVIIELTRDSSRFVLFFFLPFVSFLELI